MDQAVALVAASKFDAKTADYVSQLLDSYERTVWVRPERVWYYYCSKDRRLHVHANERLDTKASIAFCLDESLESKLLMRALQHGGCPSAGEYPGGVSIGGVLGSTLDLVEAGISGDLLICPSIEALHSLRHENLGMRFPWVLKHPTKRRYSRRPIVETIDAFLEFAKSYFSGDWKEPLVMEPYVKFEGHYRVFAVGSEPVACYKIVQERQESSASLRAVARRIESSDIKQKLMKSAGVLLDILDASGVRSLDYGLCVSGQLQLIGTRLFPSHIRLAQLGLADLPRVAGEKLRYKSELGSGDDGRFCDKYVITICGDTNPGDSYQERQSQRGKRNILAENGHAYSFENFRSMFSNSNYRVLNLEVSITQSRDSCLSGIKPYLDWTDPNEAIKVLGELSVDSVCLSNNHAMDFGEHGLIDTMEYLDGAGIGRFGAGRSSEEALAVQHIYPDNGSRFEHIIFVSGFEYRANHVEWGYYATDKSPGVNCWSAQQAYDQISALRAQFPQAFIVAFPHWGSNYAHVKDKQRRIALKIVEAGANLILGHGSHALQQVSRCRGVWVCYSLGNFVFNSPGRFSRSDVLPFGLISQLCLPRERDERILLKLYPIQSNNLKTNYLPDFVTENQFQSVIRYILDAAHDQELADIFFSKDQYGYFFAINLT